MSSKAMSMKSKIKKYAKDNNIAAQVVLQNFMFECFLVRLFKSEYRDKFVVKGGMLVAAIVGLDIRSTMDLDTTLINLPLNERQITSAIEEIISIKQDDDVIFTIKSIDPIRKDDVYGGYCVRIDARYDTILTPLSIDISTGDVITPSAIQYEIRGMFDDELRIRLWGYNIETILAEKLETILRRGIFTTRPRDFYDVYILATREKYDLDTLHCALNATAKHRGSCNAIADVSSILDKVSTNESLKNQWEKYRKKFTYAENIEYEQIMEILNDLLKS